MRFPTAAETTDKAGKADDATPPNEDVDAAVEASVKDARERERAWAAAFARAEAAEAREKAKAAGAPVVAAAVEADVPRTGRRGSASFAKRARETVRLASQGEELSTDATLVR